MNPHQSTARIKQLSQETTATYLQVTTDKDNQAIVFFFFFFFLCMTLLSVLILEN